VGERLSGLRTGVAVAVAAGASHISNSPVSDCTRTRSASMRTSLPRPGTSASRWYSVWEPFGASITAKESGSPTATPARRYPGGARSGVGVGTGGVVAVAVLGSCGANWVTRRLHNQRPDRIVTTSNAHITDTASRWVDMVNPFETLSGRGRRGWLPLLAPGATDQYIQLHMGIPC
jgi:hypothetical protein